MKVFIIFLVSVFAVMEGISLWTYRSLKESPVPVTEEQQKTSSVVPPLKNFSGQTEEQSEKSTVEDAEKVNNEASSAASPEKSIEYPRITTEEKNGRTERTIHMGVRQYAWDPDVLHVKQGEFVRLVIHNADVPHGIVIPELGVQADIPPEGAVVEFVASKKGSYRIFCSVWCGEGHMQMQAMLVVE